jgi:hypothetical protein
MVHRAANFSTAREVFLAVELARLGAAAALIERLTGFGSRWVRGVVRANGGALFLKTRDPVRWFDRDPQRLLHGRYVQMAYELQPANDDLAKRLVSTYVAYRRVAASPGLLGINECAQLIDLVQKGEAWVRECLGCQEKYLVIADRATCPICELFEFGFCRGCDQPLPEHGSRARAYCQACSPHRHMIRRRNRPLRVTVRGPVVHALTQRGGPLSEH